jgi:hypothetical protein
VKRWPLLIVSSLVLLPGGATAGPSDRIDGGRARTMTKVSADLAELYEAHASRRESKPGAGLEPAPPRVVDDRVLIDAVAADSVNVLKSDLEALGMQGAVAFGRVVSGQLPISAINALNGLASLKFARPAAAATQPRAPRGGAR